MWRISLYSEGNYRPAKGKKRKSRNEREEQGAACATEGNPFIHAFPGANNEDSYVWLYLHRHNRSGHCARLIVQYSSVIVPPLHLRRALSLSIAHSGYYFYRRNPLLYVWRTLSSWVKCPIPHGVEMTSTAIRADTFRCSDLLTA